MPAIIEVPLFISIFYILYVLNEKRISHQRMTYRQLAEIATNYAYEQKQGYTPEAFHVAGKGSFGLHNYVIVLRDTENQNDLLCVTINAKTLTPFKLEPYNFCRIPPANIY